MNTHYFSFNTPLLTHLTDSDVLVEYEVEIEAMGLIRAIRPISIQLIKAHVEDHVSYDYISFNQVDPSDLAKIHDLCFADARSRISA